MKAHLMARAFLLPSDLVAIRCSNFSKEACLMTEVTDSVPAGDDEKNQTLKKQNNPFSEQEKHGEEAQRKVPDSAEQIQGNPSVQRRATVGKEDSGVSERRSA
jgi:hypothetical protein